MVLRAVGVSGRHGAPRPLIPRPSTEPVPALSGYDADAGLPFDAEELERRLVWIWGSPRSGSTWLLRQLCHPLTPSPEATTVFRESREADVHKRPFAAVPINESFISNHLAPAFADPREVDGTLVPGTINNYLGGRPVYAYSEAYREIWAPEARRFALVRLHAFLERARMDGLKLSPDSLLVIKEVNGSHAADLVMGLMPSSRLLFLVRDGRDVVDSLLHAYRPGGFLARHQGLSFGEGNERAEGLRWAARLWACNVDVTLRAIDSHPPELSRSVRYEDLVADNESRIAELESWLELERTAGERESMMADTAFASLEQRRSGKPELVGHRAAQPGLWRDNLSGEEQRTCAEIMGPRLEMLGYEID